VKSDHTQTRQNQNKISLTKQWCPWPAFGKHSDRIPAELSPCPMKVLPWFSSVFPDDYGDTTLNPCQSSPIH